MSKNIHFKTGLMGLFKRVYSMLIRNYRVTAGNMYFVHISLIYLGNGVCGCNGNCTCNEGFSGDICECRPNEECRDPVGGEVSELYTRSLQNMLNVFTTLLLIFIWHA